MGKVTITLEYVSGHVEVDPSWDWHVDNGYGLSADGWAWNPKRALKEALKALQAIQGIVREPDGAS